MKVNEYLQQDLTEDRIDFYYRKKNDSVCEILNYLRKHSKRLLGKSDDSDILFSLNDVFYFESVDKKTFAYLEDQVLRIDLRLQELEDAFFENGFVRISKTTVLNMRVIAVLENGEKIQINRSYKAKFNQFLSKMSKGGFHNENHK